MNIYIRDVDGNLVFSPTFFQHCMSEALDDPQLKVISAHCDLDAYQTATGKAKYQAQQQNIRGLFKYRIVFQSNNIEQSILILVKSPCPSTRFN